MKYGTTTIVCGFILLLSAVMARAAEPTTTSAMSAWAVDFRYAPVWWQTCIGLPDDWQKTLVGHDGELLYDYPGPIVTANGTSGYRTRIGFSTSEGCQWIRQELDSPRVPIVRTVKQNGSIELTTEAFAAPPSPGNTRSTALVVERMDVENGTFAWASPKTPCDPAFKNIATCWAGQIHYCFRSQAGKRYTVALGFCEGYHKEKGKRVLDIMIEGKVRSTVDPAGEYGRNIPCVFLYQVADEDKDGWIDIAVGTSKNSNDNNAILNTLWVFAANEKVTAQELIAGSAKAKPLAFVDCGGEIGTSRPPRTDVVVLKLKNTATTPGKTVPAITLESQYPIVPDPDGKKVTVGRTTTLLCNERLEKPEAVGGKTVFRLPSVSLAAGEERSFYFSVVRGDASAAKPLDGIKAKALRESAERFWNEAKLPYGKIQLPDPGVQAVLDSSIRNIYQAREIKHGLPAFQVGPTCYRGLWVVDGSFLMESIAYLGRQDEARAGVKYLLGFQRGDGAIMIMDGHWKETGIAIWAAVRHARLTGDQAWLKSVWPQIERGMKYIQSMRKTAGGDAPNAPNANLVPAGMSDGGLGGTVPEYTNVYWTLVGVKAAAEAAKWLGKDEEATDWQREYDDFLATFRTAAARDMRTDPAGNRYLPIPMVNADKTAPQRAQWAFMHAVFPGKLFAAGDPIVTGNMAMLRAVEREGLIFGTGWQADGMWNYFGSFYAHGLLWLGQGQKAAQTLYAYANHASPLLCWREEQLPADVAKADSPYVGDMPHNWASAEFIRLVRHLLVLERGDELHLCEGMPPAWAKPGMTTKLHNIVTEFGPLSLEVKVAEDGSKATVTLDPPKRTPPSKILLHLENWSAGTGTIELQAKDGRVEQDVPLASRTGK